MGSELDKAIEALKADLAALIRAREVLRRQTPHADAAKAPLVHDVSLTIGGKVLNVRAGSLSERTVAYLRKEGPKTLAECSDALGASIDRMRNTLVRLRAGHLVMRRDGKYEARELAAGSENA